MVKKMNSRLKTRFYSSEVGVVNASSVLIFVDFCNYVSENVKPRSRCVPPHCVPPIKDVVVGIIRCIDGGLPLRP